MFNDLDKCIFDDFLLVDTTFEIRWRRLNRDKEQSQHNC